MRRTDLVLYCGILNLGSILCSISYHALVWRGWNCLGTSLWTVSTFFYLWYWSRKLLARAYAQETA